MGKGGRESGTNPNPEGTVSEEVLDEDGKVPPQAQRVELPEDSLTPCRVIGFLEIKEDTQNKLTFAKGCRDIVFQAKKRVSRGAKPTKAELKGRKSIEGFEDPDEAVSDDPLQNLAEAAKQRDRPKVTRVSMSLPRFRDGDDHSLTPLVREGAGGPNPTE